MKDDNIFNNIVIDDYIYISNTIKKNLGIDEHLNKDDIKNTLLLVFSFNGYADVKEYYLKQRDFISNTPEAIDTIKDVYFSLMYAYTYLNNKDFKEICDILFFYYLHSKIKDNQVKEKILDKLKTCIIPIDLLTPSFLFMQLTFLKFCIVNGANKNDNLFNNIYNEYNNQFIDLTSFNITKWQKCLNNFILEADKQIKATTPLFWTDKTINTDKIINAYGNINYNYKITDTSKQSEENTDRKGLDYISKKDINDEAKKFIKINDDKETIKKFRQKNPDRQDITDYQILDMKYKKADETTIFSYMQDLGLNDELQKIGISYEQNTDEKKKDTYIKIKENAITNIMNIDDQELYKIYGQSTINLIKYIEALVFNFIMEKGIDNLKSDTIFSINPKQYNDFLGVKNDPFYTKQKLDNTLKILTRRTIIISNTDKGSILDTTEKEITNKIKDVAEQKRIIDITKEKTLETHFIDNYYKEKDLETNQETYKITLNLSRIHYYKLIYIKNRFITDNTNKTKAIKGNTSIKAIADYIKSLLLFYTKTDRENRKNKDYTSLEYKTTIEFIKNKLTENEIIKENKRDYKRTIYNPIKNSLDYLKENKVIDYYTQAFNFYDMQVKENKRNYFKNFEAHEILITLFNNYT